MGLNALVTASQGVLRELIGEDVELVLHLVEGIGSPQVEPDQAREALINLAINARNAMPRGGTLTIETGVAVLDEGYARSHPGVSPAPHVVLTVSDTGGGALPPALDPRTPSGREGSRTGLALASVRELASQSRGTVWVCSQLGVGSTVKLYLPQVDPSAAAPLPPAPAADALPRGAASILVVEDEHLVRDLIQETLGDAGYNVLVAANGQQAVRVCQEYPESIALVVTDVVMPIMGGKELVAALAEQRRETKILFTSGYTEEEVSGHGVLTQDLRFLPKPFSPRKLLERVLEILAEEG